MYLSFNGVALELKYSYILHEILYLFTGTMKKNYIFGTKRHIFDSVTDTVKMQISVSIGTSCHKGTNFAFIRDTKISFTVN